MAFFDYIELKYDKLQNQTYSYLKNVYSRSTESYSNASPFGQVINYLSNLFQFNILSQKRVVSNFIISEADNQKAVRNLARIGGHNPTRAISATGTIKLKTKPSIDMFSDVYGGKIKVKDKTKLKNKSNGLIYTIRLGSSEENYQIGQSFDIYFNIIQGIYETQNYTGNGEINQSLSVNIPVSNTIDHFEIEVKYNDQPITIKDSMLDMLPNELACFTRTGMNGGVDVYFGNGDFGFIPNPGVNLSISYLLTDGTNGIILTPQRNDFQFLDDIVDMKGDKVNIESTFDIIVDKQISFASNGETTEFTKALMPFVSRNFVLSTPSQYIYTLKRLSMFSKVNVYNTLNDTNFENDNKIFLFLVPNISNFFTGNVNYFNVPLDSFYLDQEEKDKTLTYLRKMGNISVGTVIEIIQPTISKYIMNVYVRKFTGYSDDTIKETIITNVSTYLSDLTRDDRIVRSDIIKSIETIEGVDSVNLTFISKKNEDYHKLKPDSNLIYGLDQVLGDVVVNIDELAIIRGGWSDRNGTYYNETTDGGGLCPINVMFVGETEKNINNQ